MAGLHFRPGGWAEPSTHALPRRGGAETAAGSSKMVLPAWKTEPTGGEPTEGQSPQNP